MTPHRKIWELRDAEELVSLHLTEQDAHEAREQHLDRYRDFPDDDDLVQAAVEIRITTLSVRSNADHEGPRQQPAEDALCEPELVCVGKVNGPDQVPEPPAEAIDDLRGLIAAFDDVRPDDMTAVFYIHAYNQLTESGRHLLEALDTDSRA